MSDLVLPASACEHPIDELRCDIRSKPRKAPAGPVDPAVAEAEAAASVRAFVQCLACWSAWTQDNMPGAIVDKLFELLRAGHVRQGVL